MLPQPSPVASTTEALIEDIRRYKSARGGLVLDESTWLRLKKCVPRWV